jgi:hypothetical protein
MLLILVSARRFLLLQRSRATRETSRTEAIGIVVATAMLVWLVELDVGDAGGDEEVERARPRAQLAVAVESGPVELEIPAA